MEKMYSCPFCGGVAEIEGEQSYNKDVWSYRVKCSKCFSSSSWSLNKNDCVKMWNKRNYDNLCNCDKTAFEEDDWAFTKETGFCQYCHKKVL